MSCVGGLVFAVLMASLTELIACQFTGVSDIPLRVSGEHSCSALLWMLRSGASGKTFCGYHYSSADDASCSQWLFAVSAVQLASQAMPCPAAATPRLLHLLVADSEHQEKHCTAVAL
jgi:hypothetical protein